MLQKIQNKEMIEWGEYAGNYYGTRYVTNFCFIFCFFNSKYWQKFYCLKKRYRIILKKKVIKEVKFIN